MASELSGDDQRHRRAGPPRSATGGTPMYEDAAAARYPNTPPPDTSPQDTYAQQPWPATHPMPAWQAPPGPYTTIPQPPDPQFPPQNAHHLHPSVPWLPPGQPRHGRYNPGAESGAGIRNARLGEDLPDIRGHRGTDARATSHSAGGGLGFSPDPFLVRVQVLTLSPCPTNSLVRVSRQPIGKYVGPCP